MPQQAEMDFGVFATPQSNWARRKNAPPKPDADGLFDAAGADIICGRRQCYFDVAGDLFGHVQFKETRIPLTAIAPGRWDPVAILSACTKAHGNRVFEVDYATAKPMNAGSIDEIKVARIVGANGLRPYLSRPGRHRRLERETLGPIIQRPLPTRFLAGGWIPMEDPRTQPAPAGKPTWAFLQILYLGQGLAPKLSYEIRSALRALEDVGLLRIYFGKRGGMSTAKFGWMDSAYLPKPTQWLAPADEAALEALA